MQNRLTGKNVTMGMIVIAAILGVAFSLSNPTRVTTFLGAVKDIPAPTRAEMKVLPSDISVERQKTFAVNLVLIPHDMQINQVAAEIHFDPTRLEVVYVDMKKGNDGFTPIGIPSYNNDAGTITFHGRGANAAAESEHLATIYFHSLENIGTSELTLVTGNGGSYVTAHNADGNVLSAVGSGKVNIVLQAP